ncbi:hypothetical protein [Robiginitalea sp. IMCC43444]|uniref:hypothetical protein n=1 Tax=Robiginitalea sp. IMCC43444 TaxID=3459121 RepID=UPI0040422222
MIISDKLFKCEISYFDSPHLNQIYDGFFKLKKAGLIDLKIKKSYDKSRGTKPILKVVLDEKHLVIYDTLDGLNWLDGPLNENLSYFKNSFEDTFYFKRSHSNLLNQYLPKGCQLHPLGLNYYFIPDGNYPQPQLASLKKSIKELARDLVPNLFKNFVKLEDFEFLPIKNSSDRVLFLCRLWNPNEVESNQDRMEREVINNRRIELIQACRKEFGKFFTGGLQECPYSKKTAQQLMISAELSKKNVFMQSIKEHNICISTKGLFNSIGWKFAEYVAASRAIISEPLDYNLPGDFARQKNYLEFNTMEECLSRIESLLVNPKRIDEIMNNNFYYYNNWVSSDKLVLNTLLRVHNELN